MPYMASLSLGHFTLIYFMSSSFKKYPVPFKLQEGEVRIISLEQCQSYFDMKTITTRMICAGYESGTVDSCMVNCFLVTEEIRFSSNFNVSIEIHYYSCVVFWEHFLTIVC